MEIGSEKARKGLGYRVYKTWGCLARLVDWLMVMAHQGRVVQAPSAMNESGMAKPENGEARVPVKGEPVWLVNGCCNCTGFICLGSRLPGIHIQANGFFYYEAEAGVPPVPHLGGV